MGGPPSPPHELRSGYRSLLVIIVEKVIHRKVDIKHLEGVFGRFLFLGILKNVWLFVYVEIRTVSFIL